VSAEIAVTEARIEVGARHGANLLEQACHKPTQSCAVGNVVATVATPTPRPSPSAEANPAVAASPTRRVANGRWETLKAGPQMRTATKGDA
jgi:hypothetical protein